MRFRNLFISLFLSALLFTGSALAQTAIPFGQEAKSKRHSTKIDAVRLVDENGDAYGIPNTGGRPQVIQYGATGTSTYQVPRIDSTTHAKKSIEYPHAELHEGNHRFAKDSLDVNGTARAFVLTVGSSAALPHIIWTISTTAGADIGFYSGVTAAADGTPLTIVNNRFDSSTSSNLTISYNPTVSSNGVHCYTVTAGSGRKVGGQARQDSEKILAPNSQYMLYLLDTSGAANSSTIEFDWYLHTDKTP